MAAKNLLDVIQHTSRSKNKDIDIDSDELEAQKVQKALEADRYSSDTRDRKWLAIWTAVIVSIWLLVVLLILVLNAKWQLGLHDAILVALLGTTTLNVLGLSFIVLRGHFNGYNK
ncbi:hypothetical protein I2I11_07195 [Pontibacter sp. 172403-2]|uniref:hypothetical protein n=1 Tax=Pontibacter rufus TaxID=2791028 RepID=UPI0018AFE603|nr:hypothetical protein [Pontibacter sp. 172403-2]MBF9253072.1 hypothetical protein [Pontibacter sp. 172403-2]